MTQRSTRADCSRFCERGLPSRLVRKNRERRESGQAVVLLAIVLAIVGFGLWMLLSSRAAREEDAKQFARTTAERLLFAQDTHFLNQHLAPRAQVLFPPSWRERFFNWVREIGPIDPEMDVQGSTVFTSQFFDPHAHFEVRVKAKDGPAILELLFSQRSGQWDIDALNLTWTPAPTPSPTPGVVTPLVAPMPAGAAPGPPPASPKPTPKRRK